MKKFDSIWANGLIATCEADYGLIERAAIAVKDGKTIRPGVLGLRTCLEKLPSVRK